MKPYSNFSRIEIARSALHLNPRQLRLKAEERLGRMVLGGMEKQPEEDQHIVAEFLEQIVKELRANEAALILNGATVGGSRVAELEAQS